MLKLCEMSQASFDVYMSIAIPEFAKNKEQGEGLSPAEALKVSQDIHAQILPEGLQTPDHYFYHMMKEDMVVGMIWFNHKKDKGQNYAFIYNIEVNENQRGKGYGEEAMLRLEEKARSMGLESIKLHVFGYNKVAQNLYTKLGFLPTNINMSKKL